MLETGKVCLSCDNRKYLKEFTANRVICNKCCEEANETERDRQRKLMVRYLEGDTKIDECHCGIYYINERKRANGDWEIYEECKSCRNNGTKTKEVTIGMTVNGDQKSQSKNVKFPETEKDANDINLTTNTVKKKKIETKNIMKEKNKQSLIEKNNGELKTGRNTMNTTENSIEKKTNLPTSSNADVKTIQPLDSNQIFNRMREENLNSIDLLKNSTKQLIDYSKRLARPRTDDDGEIIQDVGADRIMMAAKCLDNARNMMKTKLDFLRFSKSLLDEKK